jgi:hypothetical protein
MVLLVVIEQPEYNCATRRVASMRRNYPALVFGATLLSFGACSTTTFTSTWKAPDGQTINPAGKTIAAVFISGDERNRHAAEDALAKDLNARGAHGVPGYTLLPNEIRGDAEDVLTRLKEAGANEVVVMRVVGEDKWPSYLQVHGSTFNASDTPGTGNLPAVTELQHFDTLVSVLVCSLDLNKVIWSSTSRTTNPKDLGALVNEVADATNSCWSYVNGSVADRCRVRRERNATEDSVRLIGKTRRVEQCGHGLVGIAVSECK